MEPPPWDLSFQPVNNEGKKEGRGGVCSCVQAPGQNPVIWTLPAFREAWELCVDLL